MQQKATVLVNPRKSEGGFTRFSFPSKISEYLCAGKPVICYKLEGIPVEYDDYLIYVEDNSIDSLKEKLVEICEKDEKVLKEIGERNKRFVSENKNNVVQTRKIINMLNILVMKMKKFKDRIIMAFLIFLIIFFHLYSTIIFL